MNHVLEQTHKQTHAQIRVYSQTHTSTLVLRSFKLFSTCLWLSNSIAAGWTCNVCTWDIERESEDADDDVDNESDDDDDTLRY